MIIFFSFIKNLNIFSENDQSLISLISIVLNFGTITHLKFLFIFFQQKEMLYKIVHNHNSFFKFLRSFFNITFIYKNKEQFFLSTNLLSIGDGNS